MRFLISDECFGYNFHMDMVHLNPGRKLLGLRECDAFDQLPDSDIARLIYRDHVAVKHSTRKRLSEEIQGLQVEQPVEDGADNRSNLAAEPLSKALKDYLLEAGFPLTTFRFGDKILES